MVDRLEQSKALANAHRVKILQWLADPQQHFANQTAGAPREIGVCVTLLTEKLGMAQPTVSRHLEVLRRSELLCVRNIGRWSYFSRNEAAIAEYKQWLQDGI